MNSNWIMLLLAVFGFGAGMTAAVGIFALIVGLKIVPRFADFTNTGNMIKGYETCIAMGGILGNVWNLFQLPILLGTVGAVIFALCGGIYVGAWAMALAEIVDTIPVFSGRVPIKATAMWVICCFALGRTLGGFLHFYLLSV